MSSGACLRIPTNLSSIAAFSATDSIVSTSSQSISNTPTTCITHRSLHQVQHHRRNNLKIPLGPNAADRSCSALLRCRTKQPFREHLVLNCYHRHNSPNESVAATLPARRALTRRHAVSAGSLIAFGLIGGAVVAAAMAASQRGDRPQANRATSVGMQKFVKGDVAGSLQEFDRALQLDSSISPYLWQRGLSLYYLKKFEEGAKQFRDDVAVNPNDTEESIWCYLCEAQLYGAEDARKRFLKVGVDSRPVLRAAQEVFQTGKGVEKLHEMARADPNGHQGFYANLYIALFHESEGESEAARSAMTAAVKTLYGSKSSDYMAKLAAVHCQLRGWALS